MQKALLTGDFDLSGIIRNTDARKVVLVYMGVL